GTSRHRKRGQHNYTIIIAPPEEARTGMLSRTTSHPRTRSASTLSREGQHFSNQQEVKMTGVVSR
ncbi:hypothetical protein AVEN_147047-2-1, partial [Araneus ventricosus]